MIAVAVVALGLYGVWALWGEELGLRGGDEPAPVRGGPTSTTT